MQRSLLLFRRATIGPSNVTQESSFGFSRKQRNSFSQPRQRSFLGLCVLRASQNRLRCLRRSFSELGGHPLSVALIVRVLDFCIKYSKEVTWQKRSPHLVLNAAPPRTWNTQLFEFGRLTQNSNTQRRRLIIVSLIYAPAPSMVTMAVNLGLAETKNTKSNIRNNAFLLP